MHFKKVQINNFRNFKSISLELAEKTNCICGFNAQGKTNFLEALYFILKGRSFRTSDMKNLVPEGGDGTPSFLRGFIVSDSAENKLEATIQDLKKTILVNGKKIAASDLQKKFPVVLFDPRSLSAIQNGPEERRHLIDDIVLTLSPEKNLIYRDLSKCLRSRSTLLSQRVTGRPTSHFEEQLSSMTDILIQISSEVTWARLETIDQLQRPVSDSMKKITGSKALETTIKYFVSQSEAGTWDRATLIDAIQKRANELKEAEIATGKNLWGPQKHEIQFFYGENDSRNHCSQGQQRALILAVKISQIVLHFQNYGRYPILLLDDVLSELDREKRTFLLDFLRGINTQTIITSTDSLEFSFLKGTANNFENSIYEVNEGSFKNLS